MTDITANTIKIQNAMERLRQERETFDQRKSQESKWFILRLAMGYSAVILLPSIAAISGYILLNSSNFSQATVTSAGAALFVDVLGLMISIWKVVLNADSVTKLSPVSNSTDFDQLPQLDSEQAIATGVNNNVGVNENN